MKIKIFGCSFMAGTDLVHTDLVWPAQIAQQLGCDWENFAAPGIGNLRIMESVLTHADSSSMNVIAWTWIDRFDVMPSATESWITLRPVLDHDLADHYFRFFHGQYRDMLTSLTYLALTIDFLQRENAPFVITVIDNLLFETVQPGWHSPLAINALQCHVRPHVHYFDGLTFLQWARAHKFDISPTLHPLGTAHTAAAAVMLPHVQSVML